MKKLSAIIMVIAFLSGTAFSASFSNIGFIDVQKVFSEYKSTESAQKELAKQEESFKKDFEDSQKQLEKAEKDGKKPEELEKLKKSLEEKLNPKRQTLMQLNQQLTSKLQQEILVAVKSVAKRVGIDMVLDKQVVITGGMDVTELVINELNK
jgi:outer membrane protein